MEEALHQMPLLIGMEVARPGIRAIFLGRYRINRILPGDVIMNFLRTIGLIGENNTSGNLDTRK